MKHGQFIKNTVVLTITSLILRTIGIVFRIWITNVIGAEGIGLYQLAMSVYVLISTFATCGITTAVTRLVSERRESAGKVVRLGILLSLLLSLITFLPTYFFADQIAIYIVKDIRLALSIRVMCFVLPFVSISSIMRGYFIGIKNTTSPSLSQIIEQLTRIAVIVLIINALAPLGIAYSTAGILFGDAVGEAVGCVILGIGYKMAKKKAGVTQKSQLPILRKILHISVPITAGRYIHTALRTVENIMVPLRLSVFLDDKQKGLSQYGMLKGMALPTLFFPASFLTALSTLMIPEISEAHFKGQSLRVRTAVEKAIGITVIASTPICAIFLLLGTTVAELLYSSRETGVLISALAPLVPFMYLESVCDGILKGLDQQAHSFLYSFIDSVTRIILIYFAVSKYGMIGFILIMIYSNLLTSILNIRRLLKVTDTPFKVGSWIIKPLVALMVSLVVGYLIKNSVMGLLGAGISAVAVVIVYILTMFFFGELEIIDGLF